MIESGRLTSKFWISAYKKSLEKKAIPMYVVRKGDETSGSIIVRVSNLRGNSKLYAQSYDCEGLRVWVELANASDSEIEEIIKKHGSIDPDIWILEVEDPKDTYVLGEL